MRTAIDVMDSFGPVFAGAQWTAWRAFLKALFALPCTESEAALIERCTGRQGLPSAAAREAWMVIGRRGGKSRIAAFLAVFCACFRRYRLAPGERGVVMCLASDRRQARVIFRYVLGLLESDPMLAAMVGTKNKESVHLTNGISIEIHTASYRTTRGYTVVAALLDEVAFWSVDEGAANPDAEIVNALRPAMATIEGALLIGLSSPYARRGELWRMYERHYGQESDVLVWQADTRTMNPTVPQSFIDRALAEDEPSARAEYFAEWRRDIEAFVSREVLDAVIVPDRLELPFCAGLPYVAFVDPSGGAADSMTLAIAHQAESKRLVLDCVREVRAPFQPEDVTRDFAIVLRSYRIAEATADYYGGEWIVSAFRKHGITIRTSDKPKSDIYKTLIPLLTSGSVEVLDVPALRHQLLSLERRTGRSGREIIDHPPRRHDDLANSVAGALVKAHQEAVRLPTVAVIRNADNSWQRKYFR